MRNIFFRSKETIFAGIFAIITLFSLALFFLPAQTTKTLQQKIAGTKVSISPTLSLSPTSISNKTTTPTTEPTAETTQTPQTIQITVVVTPTPLPQTASDKAVIHVTASGVSSFDISLDKGKNQCDVLTQAKNEGKISQLLMKYDTSLDSYGVYQINNLGKDNSVWWTYEVNGKAPGMGCNHVAANNGDSVSWKYIGN